MLVLSKPFHLINLLIKPNNHLQNILVLIRYWFLSVIYSPILGHYEVNSTPIDLPYHSPASSSPLIWVANDVTEILEWGTLIFGSVTFFSALVSYLLYKALKNP